jgi:orotidine-5'-phosphate decarboxylase
MYGWEGVKAFFDTIQYAKQKGMYVIADVKRNDIGSTAEAYARRIWNNAVGSTQPEAFNADAATVNGISEVTGFALPGME